MNAGDQLAFALDGPLPTGTTALEASAGTGKTYALAGLATRFIAEGGILPSQLLIVTFTRAATGELRARVRDRLIETASFLEGTGRAPDDDDVLLHHLRAADVPNRLMRLRRAITEFDATTISTIHGFATQVRQTLGASAGIDPDARLLDDTKDLVDEVCADVLAAASLVVGSATELPTLATLCAATRLVADRSDVRLEPHRVDQGAEEAQLYSTHLVRECLSTLDERRRHRGSVSFDDVLIQLRRALQGPNGGSVVGTLRDRFSVALIDEFQDTDRVQWDIFSTVFGGEDNDSTLVLVGDPKQAIYRFRGADIGTYLEAVGRSGTQRRSLRTNWRSDGAVLTALEALFTGVTFGAGGIEFSPVDSSDANQNRRLVRQTGEDLPALVLRMATGPGIERTKDRVQVATGSAAAAVDRDLAAYVRDLLETATLPPLKGGSDRRDVRPSDIAVLVSTGKEGIAVQAALRREGIPAVVASSDNVLGSPAAMQLRYLLQAMGRPSDARSVRTYAMSWFVGWSADEAAAASDDALVPLQEQLADWARHLGDHAVADVLARVWTDTGVVARVLGAPDGDRNLTDLDHLAELLHGSAPGVIVGVPGLLAILDAEPEAESDAELDGNVAARRIESEADAVQIMTIWKAKGLEFPIVCVPSLWRFGTVVRRSLIYTDPDSGERICDLTAGAPWPDDEAAARRILLADEEEAGERLRLLYVALTRAKHQIVVWWANAQNSSKTALAHVLFAREDGRIDGTAFKEATVPVPPDGDVVDALVPLVDRGRGTMTVVPFDDRPPSGDPWRDPVATRKADRLALARFSTVLDHSVHRWSFSSMTQPSTSGAFDPYDASLGDGGAADEQHDAGIDRLGAPVEPDGRTPPVPAPASEPGPLALLPAGAAFGTMVHAVLEKIDFASDTLGDGLVGAVDDEVSWRGLDVTPIDGAAGGDGRSLLVEGLRAAIDTPLGNRLSGLRLGDLAADDRLNELSFDMRLGEGGPPARVADVGRLVAAALGPSDPLAEWASALADGAIDVELAGFLTGSIDLVARMRHPDGRERFVVADYKTNQLTPRGADAASGRLPPGPAHPGDGRAPLPAPGAPLRRGAPPLPEVAPTRVPARDPPRWSRLPVRPGHDRTRRRHQWWAPRRGLRLGDSSGAGRRGERSPRRPPAGGGMTVGTGTGGGLGPVVSDVVLAPFVRAGVVGPFERQLVDAVYRLEPRATPVSLLTLALAARAPRFGHVCVELDRVRDQILAGDDLDASLAEFAWPPMDEWVEDLTRSVLVSSPDGAGSADGPLLRPLVWDGTRIYLQRYWHYELLVAEDLVRRSGSHASSGNASSMGDARVEEALGELFAPSDRDIEPDLQRRAALRALTHGVAIIAGGPGTGKTHAVVRILAAAHLVARAEGRSPLVALAAPTGKAAARMGEAVRGQLGQLQETGAVDPSLADTLAATEPTTIHRLLGPRRGTHFAHDRSDPLPHDMVVVDETSMVSLPLMAKLLDAVRPEATLVLVGDPFQLTSIEAGTVMADLVGPVGGDRTARDDAPLAGRVTELRRQRRFAEGSAIAVVADAIRAGDPDRAIGCLAGGHDDVHWVALSSGAGMDEVGRELVDASVDAAAAAAAGDATGALACATRIKVLAATRRGPLGSEDWSARIEVAVAGRVPRSRAVGRWRLGTPIIVTGNDPVNRVFNGDVGVVVSHEDGTRVALATGDGMRLVAPSRLDQVETWWAMTIHKSQGSEFDHAVVSLPRPGSPILTRELLYTAVTRARRKVTVVGGEDSIREAISRPVARASGLRDRLWPS